MLIDDLDFDLPEALIAQEPAARRDDARLLDLDATTGAISHRCVADLPGLLAAGDLVVVNDTRVLPARLVARRASGGRVEILLLAPAAATDPSPALLRAGGSLRAGEVLSLAAGEGVRLVARQESGHWLVEGVGGTTASLCERHGRMPLPPYIRRSDDDSRATLDRDRYQTVYAQRDGAIAAPTAGLHLTSGLLAALGDRRVPVRPLTLHVGLGTFEPVRTERLEDHAMHEESYAIPSATVDAVNDVRAQGGRVVAVGTTTVRALEASALADGRPRAGAASTDLLLSPGSRFLVVDDLLTNFHLPRSTLLALVAAFAGLECILAAYAEAVREGYRFYSYGDAMLIRGRSPGA